MADQTSSPQPIRLVVGLGNPGTEYARTRHNVGFAVLDLLAHELGASWQKNAKWDAVWAKSGETILLKPWSFMNRSGLPVSNVAGFYKIAPEQILVISDDTALPVGRLRLRLGGSGGGHNGLDSVIMHLGTEDVPRLRVGVGSAPPNGGVDYVLGRFAAEDEPAITEGVKRAVEAAKCAIDKGVVSAMNTFNKIPES